MQTTTRFEVVSAKGIDCGCVLRDATAAEIVAFHVDNRLRRGKQIGDVLIVEVATDEQIADLEAVHAATPAHLRAPAGALWW